jgi:hypothetical protein
MNDIIQDFVMLRSIIRSEVSPTLFRFISVLTILCLFVVIINPLTITPSAIGQPLTLTTPATPYHIDDIVSTRGHFDLLTGELIPGHNSTDYLYYNDSGSGIEREIICPHQKEIAIYIHGIWTDETTANEQFDRTAKSLATNNYSIPLIGFSWDSNTPLNKNGWEIAKNIAKDNGLKLTQFIFDLKNKCKDTNIRLIAHSLGAAVVNSTLITISNNQILNNNVNNNNDNFNIKSVHLLGATMDRNVAASNTTFGRAIEDIVDNFYNLRNPEDNMLEYVYRYVENHDAIGLLGIQHSLPLPSGYSERQVDSEILPIPDADANAKFDCFDSFVLLPGDNHCGYMGFRNLHPFGNILRDDGAIDIVVRNWSE